MSEDFPSDTQPSGSLVPPDRHPPTAVGTAMSPLSPQSPRVRWGEGMSLGSLVTKVLDTLDVVGDSIARIAGLRRTTDTPKG